MCEVQKNYSKELLECCVMMISILLKQYKNNSMNISDFKSHCAIKIKYIMENLDLEFDIDKKNEIQKLIDECYVILNNN